VRLHLFVLQPQSSSLTDRSSAPSTSALEFFQVTPSLPEVKKLSRELRQWRA